MHTLCHRYNVAIVCVNQVQTQIGENASVVLAPALGLTWAFCVHSRIRLTRTETIEEEHFESAQSQIVFNEEDDRTKVKTNLVHLRALSIDFAFFIPKENRCRVFIIDKGFFASTG